MGEENSIDVFVAVINKHRILEIVDSAKTADWNSVWEEFDKEYKSDRYDNEEEKHIFTDLFFHQCLSFICPVTQTKEFFTVIEKWYYARQPQNRCGHLLQNEKVALIHFVVKLRKCLFEFLTNDSVGQLGRMSEEQQRLIVSLWRQVFFEPFSALCLYWNPPKQEENLVLERCRISGYGGLAAISMYRPFDADEYHVKVDDLLVRDLPSCLKTIIIIWLVNTPYFHGTEKHRLKLMHYIPALCKALTRNPAIINTYFFFIFVQEVMTGLWRASYIGGNNLDALTAFGDFISFVMKRSFPQPALQPVIKKLDDGEKIRIGYISRNFYKQAVSCYMINRVIHHDRAKFEVCIFALGDYHDSVSELFKNNCDHFERFANLSDIKSIVKTILGYELDILIYTDIGMDPVTYMLSGLQLAPVQCALVGHGTSTGMPTIQYYLSGDFEAPQAQEHYREKLIRLPNLGAAQYLPMEPKRYLTRHKLGIPKDAVVFISCANGLKHGKDRYRLFVDILSRVPNAWIVLKPYAHLTSIDYNFAGEIITLAGEAGVADRLRIVPPVSDAGQVLGLLSIADVQLDSYPYGGWTTNMEALYMGLPIVTQEGELARSRWGAGMLRALGISEGIAATDAEYVDWAVKLADDKELRKSLRRKIKRRVKKVLFNGPDAQPAYEKVLISIYQDSCKKQYSPLPVKVIADDKVVIATSLTPANIAHQLAAMQTWMQAGFKVVSINALEEIIMMQHRTAGIEFVATDRDTSNIYENQYVYIQDILTYFRIRDIGICGIINPNVFLLKPAIAGLIRREAANSIIFGSRIDVQDLSRGQGVEYNRAFDYFFFDKIVADCYPENNEFCLGKPWWDYWLALIPIMHGHIGKKIKDPVAACLDQSKSWLPIHWFSLGQALSKHFKPPFKLTPETMCKYAEETLTIIKTLSREVSLEK